MGCNDYISSLFPEICIKYKPDAIVVQCGADCLAQDPLGGFNLSLTGTTPCVRQILAQNLPCLFLGGGGYVNVNAAKYWAQITSVIVGKELDIDIPENDEFFHRYGPSFELNINVGRRPNRNTVESIQTVINTAIGSTPLCPKIFPPFRSMCPFLDNLQHLND